MALALRDLPGQKKIKVVEIASTECGREGLTSRLCLKFALGVDGMTKELFETEQEASMVELSKRVSSPIEQKKKKRSRLRTVICDSEYCDCFAQVQKSEHHVSELLITF